MGAHNEVEAEIRKNRERQAWFVGLVRSQEGLANSDPKAYQKKVRLFGYLGYLYVFGIFALVLGFILGMIALAVITKRAIFFEWKLLLIAGVVLFSIIKALWVKLDPPEGLLLTREEAPKLYKEVDQIAEQLKAPKPDEIRLNPALNAAAEQHPRLGILGHYKNVLHLGMPLLAVLTPGEARSVIAHELGHFSGAHSKFGSWIYRVNQTWDQLYENLNKQGGQGSWLFSGFVNWFAPRFAALSFALRRANEYEADQAAAQVAGNEVAARALMRLPYVQTHVNDNFWNPLMKRAFSEATMPRDAFVGMMSVGKHEADPEALKGLLEKALQLETDYDDSHPSLRDRLHGLKVEVPSDLSELSQDLAKPVERSAAEEFFGNSLPMMLSRLQEENQAAFGQVWAETYREHTAHKQKLEELDSLKKERELTYDERLGYAVSLHEVSEDEGATEPLFRELRAEKPDDATPAFFLGLLLLEKKDREGVTHMEDAARLNPVLADAARDHLARYHFEAGEESRLEELRDQALEEHTRQQMDLRMLSNMHASLPYGPHDLSQEEMASLVEQLEATGEVLKAYLVSLHLPATGRLIHVLFALPKRKLFETGSEAGKLVDVLGEKVDIGREFYIISDVQSKKAWEKAFFRIPNSMIYEFKKK